MTYSDRFPDFPAYIIGCTKDIWEDRGVQTLKHYYHDDIVVRTPMGIQRGNDAVIASTMATIHEFPDRQLFGEDVIWSNDPDHGYLSSHRLITTATHGGDGQFGPATGRSWTVRVIADCAARGETIYDEWLVRDYGGIVRALGYDPRHFAAKLIEGEGGSEHARVPFLPENDIDGGYRGRGNDDERGHQYAETLTRIMDADFAHIMKDYDRAIIANYAGGRDVIGRDGVTQFWVGLRSAFPSAEFRIHHQIGMPGELLSPRASIRWSLDGTHDGWGSFGRPTGARVHVMGMSHAEYGPWGQRREYTYYDEIAVWKQILMAQGAV